MRSQYSKFFQINRKQINIKQIQQNKFIRVNIFLQMQEELKKIYLMAARNSNFAINRTAYKYLPLKNDSVNYDTLFQVKKNLKEVQFTFHKNLDRKNQDSLSKSHEKQKRIMRDIQKTKRQSPYSMPSLLQIFRQKNPKKSKNKKQNQQQNYNITISENGSQQQNQHEKNVYKANRDTQISQTKIKSQSTLEHKQVQLKQSQLDLYIDQYLQEIMKQKNSSIKEEIQSDRKSFIQKAIKRIKRRIKENESKTQQKVDQINPETKILNDAQIQGKQTFQNKRCIDSIDQKNRNQQNFELKIPKQKRKCKSTQLICSQNVSPSKTKKTLFPSLNEISSTHIEIPHRKIYDNTPNYKFINKVGKTFYANELNLLNKTLELQKKNRERAQRFFRRRLINIEKQAALEKEKVSSLEAQSHQHSFINLYGFY